MESVEEQINIRKKYKERLTTTTIATTVVCCSGKTAK